MICLIQLLSGGPEEGIKKPFVCIFADLSIQNRPKWPKLAIFPFKYKNLKNLIEKYENLNVDIKMYMNEVSKSKISDLKAQKMFILWTVSQLYVNTLYYLFILTNMRTKNIYSR